MAVSQGIKGEGLQLNPHLYLVVSLANNSSYTSTPPACLHGMQGAALLLPVYCQDYMTHTSTHSVGTEQSSLKLNQVVHVVTISLVKVNTITE